MRNEVERLAVESFPFFNKDSTKEILIKDLDYKGKDSSYPKFAYTITRFGQANYLIKKCKEINIGIKYFAGDLQIFSKRKLPAFVKLIKESMQYDNIPYPKVEDEVEVYETSKGLLGVFILSLDTLYCNEKTFHYTINHIYKRELPRPMYYKILKDSSELANYLLYEKDIII